MGIAGIAVVVAGALAAGDGSGVRASAMPPAAPDAPAGERAAREFRGSVERLPAKLRRRMKGVSWHRGCPVGLGDLRLVKASRVDFHGRPRQGRLVVNEDYAKRMVKVLRRL